MERDMKRFELEIKKWGKKKWDKTMDDDDREYCHVLQHFVYFHFSYVFVFGLFIWASVIDLGDFFWNDYYALQCLFPI